MSNKPETLVTEHRCGDFQARFRYVERDGGTVLVDAYIRPVTLEEVSIIATFFAGKRIFWNHAEDGTLKLLLNIKVESPERFEERFFRFLVDNIPSIKRMYSLDNLVAYLREEGWIVHTQTAGLEASKTIPSHGRLEIRAVKSGPTAVALEAVLTIFPGSLSEALNLAKRLEARGYNVESRFPVLKAVKRLGEVPICDAGKTINNLYGEAVETCLSRRS